MATFEIRDSGPGIPADDMQRIFEPFARSNVTAAAAASA
jgi:signal transduction histidine kinase